MKTKTRKNTQVIPPMNDNALKEFMDKKEIAREFGVTTRTIDDWMKRRLIPFAKIGRCVRFHWPGIKKHLTDKATVQAA